jgi:hypothetical protein
VGPSRSSPPQMREFEEGIEVSWTLPPNRISRRLSAEPAISHGRHLADDDTIDEVDVQFLMPNS